MSYMSLQAKILVAIGFNAANAYEIYKKIKKQWQDEQNSFHSVYSAIQRAKKSGLLSSEWQVQGGKSLLVYSLSADGQKAREDFITFLAKINSDLVEVGDGLIPQTI
jgi:DNA-binding PadR family transcriptional regulator